MIKQFHSKVYIQSNKSRDSNSYLYVLVHSNIFHNSQKAETTQISINRLMDK